MTTSADQSDTYIRLAAKYAGQLSQSRDDLLHLSNLHQDFVNQCFAAIDASRARLQRAPTGEIFPHLVAQSLALDDKDRRLLMAAWLALFGYICIVDHELDQNGYLNGRTSIAASALLGWGVATLGRYAAGTPFADVFLDNVNRAFSGQYEDMQVRGDPGADRQLSDTDKNRAIVAAAAGFCAAARESDDRVIRSAEALLGPFQILDDLEDLQEDHGQDNITIFVRIVRDYISTAVPLSRNAMYGAIIRDSRTKAAVVRAAEGIDRALLLLDPNRDLALVDYIADLRDRTAGLIRVLDDYQREPAAIKEPEVMRQIEQLANGSS
ncbi:MAG TPA: hypothetical protein VN769_12625 [Xanthobacteraceae bacterium]|nr:hypothetical protein [Xanthobacteraceae bacterium]